MNSIAIDLEQRAARMMPPVHRLPQKIDRAVQMALHYRWSQMARRGLKSIQQKFFGRRHIKIAVSSGKIAPRDDVSALASLAQVLIAWRAASSVERSNLDRGRVCLLHEPKDLGSPIDWAFERIDRPSHLWRFQLHYHEFLLPLAQDANATQWQKIWDVVSDWINRHTPDKVLVTDDSWHPYCISRRISSWICLLASHAPPQRSRRIVESMYAQASYLADHLERDPGGNHLLENLTGLGLAACFLNSSASDKWLGMIEAELPRELTRQVLPYGEHFERAPMYHCQVAANLLALGHAATSACPALSKVCLSQAAEMLAFLQTILHPDGEIPLFGDSGFGESPSVSCLRELAACAGVAWSGADGVKSSPYWVARRGASALIFDAGAVGARELAAHSHCDLLGLEASVEGRRWVVDSGNFDYGDGTMRQYCRSAVAHNVVVVDDRETCDVWSKFRMGFRGQPTKFETGQRAGADWAAARHNAYRRAGVRWLERLLVSWGDVWVCADFARSEQRHKLTGYLHLMPDLSVKQIGERRFEMSDQNATRRIDFFGVDDVELGTGWYCPSFGLRSRNPCFVYRQSNVATTALGWLMDRSEGPSIVELDGPRLFLRVSSAAFEWSFE